jgi:hypothetical protein
VAEHGIPRFERMAEALRGNGGPPEGAEPWAWFVREVRDHCKAPWKWDPAEQTAMGRNGRRTQAPSTPDKFGIGDVEL